MIMNCRLKMLSKACNLQSILSTDLEIKTTHNVYLTYLHLQYAKCPCSIYLILSVGPKNNKIFFHVGRSVRSWLYTIQPMLASSQPPLPLSGSPPITCVSSGANRYKVLKSFVYKYLVKFKMKLTRSLTIKSQYSVYSESR